MRIVDEDESTLLEARMETVHLKLREMLSKARGELKEWHEKLVRLRHRVSKVPVHSKFRGEFEEASTATLLVALQLKAHVLTQLAVSRAPVLVQPDRHAAFIRFLQDHIIHLRDSMFDRHCVGVGVLQLYAEDDELALRAIPPEHVLFDTSFGFRRLPYVFRKVATEQGELWEYYDAGVHVLFSEKAVQELQPNLLGRVPFYLLPCISAGNGIYPLADGELALPQQQLLDEVRATLLDSARRGKPVLEYRVGDIEEAELRALESGDASVIGTQSGQSLRPVAMPISTAEWASLEQLARQDMDSLLGISDILRSSLASSQDPRVSTATQALAELALQNARLAADSLEVENALRQLAEDWHVLTYNEEAEFLPTQEPNRLELAQQAGVNVQPQVLLS